ncbi:MAG: hypothetical protein WA151_03630 [Desulfatirhabdiaceae bacterium]
MGRIRSDGAVMREWGVGDDFHHVSSQGALLQKIHLELGKSSGVVLIDDSIELKEKIRESLAVRKWMFELSTVSFGEFADFKTGYRYTDRLREFFLTEPGRTDQLFRKYLMYGGYPRVILADTHKEKLATIYELHPAPFFHIFSILTGTAFSRGNPLMGSLM